MGQDQFWGNIFMQHIFTYLFDVHFKNIRYRYMGIIWLKNLLQKWSEPIVFSAWLDAKKWYIACLYNINPSGARTFKSRFSCLSIYCSCATQKMMLISSSICKHNFSKLNPLQVNNFQKVSFFAILSKNLNANSTQHVEFLFKFFDEVVNKRDIRKIFDL